VVVEEEKPQQRSRSQAVKEEPVVEVNVEEEPVPTAMAVAFASLQDKSETTGTKEQLAKESKKHREMQAEVLARTLASSSK
jgi:hypothetical protein